MLTIGQAIQVRPHPHLAEWEIALVAYVEPFDDGYAVCDYWIAGERHVFSFMQKGCQWDNQVLIENVSQWRNSDA